MKLILVRHGQSISNKNEIVEGWGDSNLSELGLEQAKKVAQRLKEFNPDVIYCSDLERTRQTAQPTFEFHTHLIPNFSEDIREYSFGEHEGKTYQFFANYPVSHYSHPSCESLEVFNNRIKEFLTQINQKHQGENVIVFTHGWVIFSIIAQLQNKDFEDVRGKYIEVGNTSITIIEDNQLKLFNCTKHLE